MPPAPAPRSRIDPPPARIVLTDTVVPRPLPSLPTRIVGDGILPSPGNGDGVADTSGAGTGRGTGTGAGEGDGEGAATPQRRLQTRWAPSMRMRDLRRYFPRAALRQRIAGAAALDCLVVENDRVRDCRLLAEAPAGYGFGEAALRAEDRYRVEVVDLTSGERVYNERITVRAGFPL